MSAFPSPRPAALSRRRLLQLSMLGAAAAVPVLSACSNDTSPGTSTGSPSGSTGGTQAAGSTRITVANVSNPVTVDLQELTKNFTKANPDIVVEFSSLPETQLREQVAKDVAAGGGQFDIIAIGPDDVAVYGQNGWLADLTDTANGPAYDKADLIPSVLDSLTIDGKIYALPVYAESSFLMYRKDIFESKGLTMPDEPTWDEVADLANKVKTDSMAGIALRGLPGENQVPLMTVIYTYGGRLFTPEYQPTFTEPETRAAIGFYVDLARSAGTKGAASAGFNQVLSAFAQGQAAMLYDATVAAGTLEDPAQSTVVGKVGYAAAPRVKSPSAGWYWSWDLAVTAGSKNKEAAAKFIAWATSKEYIQLAGSTLGWTRIPPATRTSTYSIPDYTKVAPFAAPTLAQLSGVGPQDILKPTLPPGLPGAYFLFPEWADVYTPMSQQVAAAIAGDQTADQAVDKIQTAAEDAMRRAGLWNG